MTDAIERFGALHEAGCFVLPNPWDVGSARFLERLGFPALGTSSAGLAFSMGRPDVVGSISLEETLAHTREIVAATRLPVNVDLQEGYAANLDELATNVKRCVQTGAAGLSIEDATGDPAAPLFERERAIRRVRAARAAIDQTGGPVVLTARCEAFLVGEPEAERVVLDRLVAFAELGADCLYAPGIRDPDLLGRIVKAVAPRPVNALAFPGATVEGLAGLGVRRVSVGSALARVAWAGFMRAAQSIASTGAFAALGEAAAFSTLNELFDG